MSVPDIELKSAADLPEGFQGPRGSIVVQLKRRGALTAKDLAQALDLSLNAIRHHLKELEAESVVAHWSEARGVGAPVYRYGLTEQGEALFPERYQEALTEVLDHMVSRIGREGTLESLNDHYRKLGERLENELAGAPAGHRVDKVVQVMRDEGYMAVWEGGRERGTLTAHNCAMRAVAHKFPEICEAEQNFLTGVLAARVTRRSHMLSGCSACEYHIDFRPPDPHPRAGSGVEEHA